MFDDKRRFAAIGLHDPDSPIAVKVVHAGSPATIDGSWWRHQLAAANARRRPVVDDPKTTGWRMVNGENDGFPGLVVDRYDRVVVIKIYTAAWFPHLGDVLDALIAGPGAIDGVVLRLSRRVAAGETHGLADGDVIAGHVPDEVEFLERGLTYIADPRHGQKTGFFLDQRDNRRLVGSVADGRTVLDVFCCTGGFSAAAAAGGARAVTSVDIAPSAIATTERVMAVNRSRFQMAGGDWHGITGDAFEVMRDLRRRNRCFDLIVVDPPSFAQRQTDVDGALRAYRRLTDLALALLDDGGLLFQASCSSRVTAEAFHATVHEAARASGVDLVERTRTTHAVDHPVSFPEGAYLKAVLAEVRR